MKQQRHDMLDSIRKICIKKNEYIIQIYLPREHEEISNDLTLMGKTMPIMGR